MEEHAHRDSSPKAPPPPLPEAIPIFPLTGALLLPGGVLPLNIFEPRYRAMIHDARTDAGIIGMIQPRVRERVAPDDHPALYGAGCAGRITEVTETPDGRSIILLDGLSRFDVVAELAPINGYRRVRARYWSRRDDFGDGAKSEIARATLLTAAYGYFDRLGIAVDWQAMTRADDARLLAALATLCPFAPQEKQAILEARGLIEQARVIAALLALSAHGADGETRH